MSVAYESTIGFDQFVHDNSPEPPEKAMLEGRAKSERTAPDPGLMFAFREIGRIMDEAVREAKRGRDCIRCCYYSMCDEPGKPNCQQFTPFADNSRCFDCDEARTCQEEAAECRGPVLRAAGEKHHK